MKDMFNKRQRFSLRKYSFGVASVLLGVAVFSSAQTAKADEVTTAAEATVAATAANSEASPTSTATVVSEAANTTVETVAESTVATPVASEVATSEASSTTPASTSVAPTSETTAAVVNAAEEVANRRGTRGYAANAVETPSTASMPRREGYVAATTGASLLAADSVAVTPTADPNNADDPMPTDDQVTDTSKFGKSNPPELNGFVPVIGTPNKDGNKIVARQLTGAAAAFAIENENKRVAEIWSVRDASGREDAYFVSFVFDIPSGTFEMLTYDSSKTLIKTESVAKQEGAQAKLQLAGNPSSAESEQAFVSIQFEGGGYNASYAGTDGDTSNGRPSDLSGIKRIYSALLNPQTPESYRQVGNPSVQKYIKTNQTLPFAASMTVNYLIDGTLTQLRPSNEFHGYVGDTYTTSAATDAELDAEYRDKGYELVTSKLPKNPDGTISGTYFGGKGFVAVRDFSNNGFNLRARLTVLNDDGDLSFELWNRDTGKKIPIGGYKKRTTNIAEGDMDLSYLTPDNSALTEYNYVSLPIRAASDTGASSAEYGSVRFIQPGTAFNQYLSSGWQKSLADVVYWYARPKGNVNVEYYIKDTDTKLQDDVKVYGTEGESVKETYNTATDTLRPATITKDGKTYRLVESNGTPDLKSGSDAETGTVEKTEKTVKYQYEEVKKGNVVVEYYDTKGNVIKDPVVDTPESDEGTDYDTKDHKDDKITKDGKTYFYKEIKNDSDPETGKVKEGTTTVKYVYEEAGNVNINYIATDGTVIKPQVKDTVDAEAGTAYDATQNDEKPATIDFNGKTYRLVTVAGNTTDGRSYDANGVANGANDAPATGTVESGVTKEVTYVYEEVKKDDKAVIIFRHVNADGTVVVKELERTSEFDGKEGDAIQYTEAEKQAVIDKYRAQGFRVVADQYGTGKNYDGKDGVDTYYIDLTPYIVPVTPDKPLVPGNEVPTDPTSPEDPDPKDPKFPNPNIPTHPKDPKYPTPDNDEILKLTEDVNRTITYYAEINGVKTPIAEHIATQKDTVNFERKGTVNLVTGETTLGDWTSAKDNFDTVTPQTTVTINGVEYTISTVAKVVDGTANVLEGKKTVDGETVAATDADLFYEVVYTPVTPEKKDDTARVIYQHTDKSGNTVISELERTSDFTGKEGEDVNYSTEDTIKKYQKLGYELVDNGFDKDGTKPKYDGQDGTQEFIVKLTPIIVPITPEKPLEPGKEIPELPENPKYPDPKNPDGKTKEDLYKLTEEVKRTVTYYTEDKDGNNRTPIAESEIPTKSDTLNFRREGSINLVTGETTLGDWKLVEAGKDYTAAGEETGSFSDYNNPVKEGYLVVKEEVAGVASEDSDAIKATGAHTDVKATDGDIEDKVIYRPIAKYVPKFPPGETPEDPWNEVPYTNDPNDPTKITPPTDPKQPPIPYVPGMEPKDPGTNEPLKPVDPEDPKKGYIPPTPTTPFEDTEIPYEVVKGSVIVRHVIEGTETDLKDPETVKDNVKVGEAYTTAGESEIVKDGKTYVLVGHRANSDATSGDVEKGTKTVVYEYKLKEDTPVTPDKKDDKAVIIFRHVNADGTVVVKELERTSEFDGKEGDAIQYTEAEKQAVIDKYRAQGFRVVADQYGTGKNYDGKEGVDTYYIDLTPYIVPVTPDKPLTPGGEVPTDPNSPKDPDPNDPKFPNPDEPTHPKDPKYPTPDNPDITKLTEEVNRVITYYAVINGVKTAIPTVVPTQTDTVNFERKGTVNLVTGETTLENWNPQTGTFNTVTPATTITIDGVEYTTSTVVNGETVNPTDDDKAYEVVYTPVATPEVKKGSVTVEYIEVDANGNKVRNLQVTTDVVRDAEVGTNYTTRQKAFAGYDFVQVSPTSAPANGTVTEGTQHVVYEYRAKAVTPVAKDDTARVIYQHTDKSGNVVVSELERTSDFTGKEGEDVNYSTEDTIKKYQKLGYELVSNGFDNDGTKPKYDGQDGAQEFIVKLTPIIVPITPEKPLEPGKEIPELPESPKYPDPKDPDGKTKEELYKLTEEVKRTVTYYTENKDGSNRQPVSESDIPTKTDTLNFRREGSINLVTGETTLGDWKLVEAGKDYTTAGEETGSFSDYTNDKVLPGYILSKEEVDRGESTSVGATGAHTGVKATDADYNDKVIYIPISNYVPVVPRDPQDPNSPDPKFPEDPWGPDKPNVPYTNDPQDPGKIVPPTDPSQPPIPYVPGYTPKDPKGNPLKPVDPTDPTKGYEPPVPEDPTEPTPIPYERDVDPTPEKKDDKAVIIFRHVNADGTVVVSELERTSEFDGKEGDAIQYTEAEKQAVIDKYRAQGYRVVADQYGAGKNYDGKDGVDTYYIDLTPYIVPVTPDKPLTPGGEVPTDPNSPKDPDPENPLFPNPDEPTHPKDPKYPDPKDPDGGKADDMYKLTEEVNRTITYYAIINGVKTPIANVIPTSKDTLNFQRKGTINLVTGETTLENWNPQTGTFNTVTPATTITIDGVEYTTSTVVNGETVNPTDDDKFYEVVYTPVETPEAPKGNVIVKYVKEDGTPIKEDREDTPSSPVGTDYDTNEPGENPTRITKDGKTYELVRVDGNEKGKVVEGTTTVTYVYREVTTPTPETPKGNVIVKYVIKGTDTEIADPRTDTPNSPVGTDYNTNEPGENPTTITKDGKTYRLVGRQETSSPETGKVVEGTTVVVYEYEEVVTPTPDPEPKPEPKPEPDPEPTPDPEPNKPTPPTPEKPVEPNKPTPPTPGKPVVPTEVTPGNPTPQTPASPATPANELPQTGEDSSQAAAVAGVGILGSLLVGLGLSRKKKED